MADRDMDGDEQDTQAHSTGDVIRMASVRMRSIAEVTQADVQNPYPTLQLLDLVPTSQERRDRRKRYSV